MNRRQAGGVYFLPIVLLYWGASLVVGGPYSCFCCLVRAGDAVCGVAFEEFFRRIRGSNPPTTLSNEWVVPTEPAGHEDVQPPAPRSTLDIIVDPCRFGFYPPLSSAIHL